MTCCAAQIILAFGNYMNSSRRGAVYGFKLESLSKVRPPLPAWIVPSLSRCSCWTPSPWTANRQCCTTSHTWWRWSTPMCSPSMRSWTSRQPAKVSCSLRTLWSKLYNLCFPATVSLQILSEDVKNLRKGLEELEEEESREADNFIIFISFQHHNRAYWGWG